MTNPVSSPFGPTWYGATMVAPPERSVLAHDLDVDVCVIGGGLAGLTVAREVARRGWSVVVLEAERIAWNASGRNGGLVLPGFAERIEAIVDRVGLDQAKKLWALSTDGVEYVRAAIRDTGMPGVTPVDGFLKPSRTDEDVALARHVSTMQRDFGAAVEMWPTDRVRETLRSRNYFQALHWPQAFHIHPLNYAFGLAEAAERAGARIFEATRALAIDSAGVRKRIDTPAGRVRAHHVVLAGGPHLGALVPALAGTLVPVTTSVGTTAPLGGRLLDAIRYPGAVADPRLGCDFYRIVDGDRLLWGSGISALRSPQRGLARRIARRILRVYPQLGPVEIAYAWSGLMGFAVHRMPQIGELANGVWLAGAFGGHGLNTTAMAGDLIARAIVEGDDRWQLFSPYELVWAGGRSGRVAAQILFWATKVREAAAEAIARARDSPRKGTAEKAVPPTAGPEIVKRRHATAGGTVELPQPSGRPDGGSVSEGARPAEPASTPAVLAPEAREPGAGAAAAAKRAKPRSRRGGKVQGEPG